jgi:outer membrane protein assembly factor BamB
MLKVSLSLIAFLTLTASAAAADWPTYRGDAERTGFTAESLPAQLSLSWTYLPTHPPSPAWPRDDRMLFDRASDVVVSNGVMIFGNSSEGQVIALDAATGALRWTFYTDAPVRFAPAIWKDKAYVVSDDGQLYCLSVADGSLVQKWRGGPSDELILGNGRMVSRWPARGGSVIRDGVVYFAAGIWQSEGIYLKAIDAETGKLLWQNDKAGSIYMPQPHGGANANSGVSAQGYLVATENELIVPTGRAVPAGFARRSGTFLYYHLQANGHIGGTQTVVAGDAFYNGGTAFRNDTGALIAKLGLGAVAATPDGIVFGTKKDVRMVKLIEKTAPDRKGVPAKTFDHQVLWSLPNVDGSQSLIVAGNVIVAGGGSAAGKNTVTAIDRTTKSVLWSAEMDGVPYGLAAANGRLYVSTDRGSVHCYSANKTATPATVASISKKPTVDANGDKAATEIVQRTGVSDGFCLDLDCGNGDLAIALAQRTRLQIYALNPNADEVLALRKKLSSLGLYGTRITVHQGSAKDLRYGKYFADLVISSGSMKSGPLEASAENMPFALRPGGGALCTGKVGQMEVFKRPALAKAGSWTHQYSDIGNSSCSTDEIVKGDLRALWFRDVDLEMPQRHGRGHAPLFQDGRMFVEGMGALRAVDAYNGRNLWEFALPNIQSAYNADHLSGTSVTGSNFCVAGGSVYIHDKLQCYRLDAATGRKLGEFKPPQDKDGKPGSWGYIACDGKLLFGSLANPEHIARFAWRNADVSELWGESAALFAVDAKTGELRWRYDAEESIRNNAIAIGNGRVHLIDRAIAGEDKLKPVDKAGNLPAVAKVNHPPGRLVTLEADTGKILWKGERTAFGTMLALSSQHDALVMGYQSTRFKLPSEIGGKIAVYEATSGKELWQKEAKYITRPLINDDKIYTQNEAWDLRTGKEQGFVLNRSYGCGQLAGSKHMLLFRSATLGYLDLSRGSGVENYGGIRPGCWINALPVGGLVLVPDASAGCACSYQNRSWMALSGVEDE